MADSRNHKHLTGLSRFSTSEDYVYPKKVGGGGISLNSSKAREGHASRMKSEFEAIRQRFDLPESAAIDEGLAQENVVYVQFYSDWGYKFDFDQFDHGSTKPKYRLVNISVEKNSVDEELIRYKVLVMLNERGVTAFLNKIEAFSDPEKDSSKTTQPKNAKLLFNIHDIKLATLEAFWTDGQFHSFPETEEQIWWEVWFRKSDFLEKQNSIFQRLINVGAVIGQTELQFVEHVVRLVKATKQQLIDSLLLSDCLAELRKPQEINDFITADSIDFETKREYAEDLLKRTKIAIDDSSVLICLLDSGVNNKHDLLTEIIKDSHLYAWKDGWGVADTHPGGGHGTGMAGLILYGDLTDLLGGTEYYVISNGVESFKIIHPSSATNPELFGVVYRDGCNTPFIDRPKNKRVYCISVTNSGIIDNGRPSSSSAAIDEITFGNLHESAEKQLIIVSGGNIAIRKHSDYPTLNFQETIQDPGQAYNAITVGGFTLKDKTKDGSREILALRGAMAPCNSTSSMWENQWANKPDIVLEAGNYLIDGDDIVSHSELDPLSLDKDFRNHLFLPFGGTSSAAAFAAKMAAELMTEYPGFWPETIRGLIIHSAEWTDAMKEDLELTREEHRKRLICSVGYGVPNLSKALQSADNALTIIGENEIRPYRLDGSKVKYNEFHLYEIPWPEEVLRDIVAERNARITITLSYFIEPNPGSKQYSKSFSYHSYNLDFKLIKPTEDLAHFKRRISAAADENNDTEMVDRTSEPWSVKERIRSKGSIKKDFLDTNGADLSTRKYLAVYPKTGWYKSRKKLEKYDDPVRYSLIVSIETEDTEIDIYTPVANLIAAQIEL